MLRRAVLFVVALLTSAPVLAQLTWQPTQAPLVTAQNESWYLAGEPIEWAGAFYYPGGALRYFDAYQMTRAGSYRGIPLYSDARGPNDTVYLPIGSGLMQPYQQTRGGQVQGAASTIPPGLPSIVRTEPTGEETEEPAILPMRENLSEPLAVTGTMGRTLAPPGRVESVVPPTGVDGIWVNYDGARWFLSGKTAEFDSATFTKIGEYYGFPVYQRGDPSTIYIPVTSGRLARYSSRR